MLDILIDIVYNNDMKDVNQNKKLLMRSYKYRLYPTKEQADRLQWILDRCRELYNAALQEREEAWKYAQKSVKYNDQQNDLPEIKRSIRPEYQEINAHVLTNVLNRLDKAFQAFFRRVKRGENPGFPRFQSYGRYDSFTYPDTKGLHVKYNADSTKKNGKLTLSKFGMVNICLHRQVQGAIKTITIKREGERWYAIFSCEIEQEVQYHPSEEAIGIDLGLLHFATLSTGETIGNPRYLRKAEHNLKRLQQSLSRKKRGSNRRKKAVKAVVRAYRGVGSRRRAFLHKASRDLVSKYQTIVFEDLAVANLVKRPKPKQDEKTGQYLPNGASAKAGLNKSINDAAWSQFVRMCIYKAAWAGGKVVQVDPKYTSQKCSGCGAIAKKALSERWHSCSCGCELDRDHNAAINILWLGLQVV